MKDKDKKTTQKEELKFLIVLGFLSIVVQILLIQLWFFLGSWILGNDLGQIILGGLHLTCTLWQFEIYYKMRRVAGF